MNGSRSTPDVLIIGAGPAGSMAALHLARRGRSVLLLDGREFPRDKACGDALIPDALRAIERAGLLDRVRESGMSLSEASAFAPSRAEIRIPCDFVTIKRWVLDDLLRRAALDAGAAFRRARVTAIHEPGDLSDAPKRLTEPLIEVDTRDDGPPLSARYVLIATGADVSLLRGLGDRPRGPSAVAIRQYVRSDLRLDRLVLSFDDSILPGYAWIFPVAENEYNVGCGVWYGSKSVSTSEVRQVLDRFLGSFPLARELMAKASSAGPIRGARLRCGLGGAAARPSPRVLAIGETLGTTYPLSGEGIGKAMETAEIAATIVDRALRENDPDVLTEYAGTVERLRPHYRGYESAQRWLSHPRVCDFVIRRARKNRFLRDAFEGMLRETVDPRAVFSLRGMARALVG